MESSKPKFRASSVQQEDTHERGVSARKTREPAPRTFRSSAPSPDRSLSMSCTPPAGIIPPTNTPVDATKYEYTAAPARNTSSSSSSQALLGEKEGDEDEDGSWDSDVEDDSREAKTRYDPKKDTTFHTLYRQSKSSVTKINTSTVSVSIPNSYHAADSIIPSFLLSNQGTGTGDGKGNEAGDEDERRGAWNPPHAPKAMQSHQITWINDKKVGERINGVQVPIESDEEESGRGKAKGKAIKKGLSGKLRIGKNGGRKR